MKCPLLCVLVLVLKSKSSKLIGSPIIFCLSKIGYLIWCYDTNVDSPNPHNQVLSHWQSKSIQEFGKGLYLDAVIKTLAIFSFLCFLPSGSSGGFMLQKGQNEIKTIVLNVMGYNGDFQKGL